MSVHVELVNASGQVNASDFQGDFFGTIHGQWRYLCGIAFIHKFAAGGTCVDYHLVLLGSPLSDAQKKQWKEMLGKPLDL